LIGAEKSHLFLVGFMGSGKSTVAETIAARSGRPHVDLDREIEKRNGRTIAELFSKDGEEQFRRVETKTLATIVKMPPSIVSTGGGAFAGVGNRQRMRRHGVTIWLDVALDEARQRVGSGGGRPLWQDDDPIAFRGFFERRRALYWLADIRVVTAQKTPKMVDKEILERIQGFFD